MGLGTNKLTYKQEVTVNFPGCEVGGSGKAEQPPSII